MAKVILRENHDFRFNFANGFLKIFLSKYEHTIMEMAEELKVSPKEYVRIIEWLAHDYEDF